MYDLVICSMFKDSQLWNGYPINQVNRYIEQISNQDHNINNCAYRFLVAKSKDNTINDLHILSHVLSSVEIYEESKVFTKAVASTLDRIVNSSEAANYFLNLVRNIGKTYLWIESDLVFDNNLISNLSQGLNQFDIIAPCVYMKQHQWFYDTWGFINIDGSNIPNSYNSNYDTENINRYKEMQSIGSCALINGEIINSGINFGANGFRYLCGKARENGFKIGVDFNTRIYHPDSKQVANRWI